MISKPAASTKRTALNALDGVTQITKNEMLKRGDYLTAVVDEKLAAEGAICGGRRACLIGSAYVGAGIKMRAGENQFWGRRLPGVDPDDRAEFTARRPGLRLALDALDVAATERITGLSRRQQKNIADWRRAYSGHEAPGIVAEALFEAVTDSPSKLNRDGILALVDEARAVIEAA